MRVSNVVVVGLLVAEQTHAVGQACLGHSRSPWCRILALALNPKKKECGGRKHGVMVPGEVSVILTQCPKVIRVAGGQPALSSRLAMN